MWITTVVLQWRALDTCLAEKRSVRERSRPLSIWPFPSGGNFLVWTVFCVSWNTHHPILSMRIPICVTWTWISWNSTWPHFLKFPPTVVKQFCSVNDCLCAVERRLGGTEVERGRGVGSGPSTLSDEHLSLRKHTKLSSTRGHMPCRLEHCCSPQRAPSHPTPHLTRVYEIKRLRHSPWKLFPSFTECSSLNRIFEVPHAPSGFGFTLGKMMFRESHRKVFHAPKMFALM